MPQERSEAYFQQLCERPAIETLRTILCCGQLTYSGRVLLLLMLLEPKYKYEGEKTVWVPKKGLERRLAKKLGVSPSSVSRWVKRLKGVNPFETRLMEAKDGKAYMYFIIKRATTP